MKRVLDTRLNNTSQLAGFTKRDDLPWFVQELLGIDCVHLPQLAPTAAILDAYRKEKGTWEAYERDFRTLLEQRRVEQTLSRELLDGGCLLCSEASPAMCHRRVAAEYLQSRWEGVEIVHL